MRSDDFGGPFYRRGTDLERLFHSLSDIDVLDNAPDVNPLNDLQSVRLPSPSTPITIATTARRQPNTLTYMRIQLVVALTLVTGRRHIAGTSDDGTTTKLPQMLDEAVTHADAAFTRQWTRVAKSSRQNVAAIPMSPKRRRHNSPVGTALPQ